VHPQESMAGSIIAELVTHLIILINTKSIRRVTTCSSYSWLASSDLLV
jgi:hypothetical protein